METMAVARVLFHRCSSKCEKTIHGSISSWQLSIIVHLLDILKMYRALGWSLILETESQSSKFHAIRFIQLVYRFTYTFRWFFWINVSVVTSPMDPYVCISSLYWFAQKILVSGTIMVQNHIWSNEGSLHHGASIRSNITLHSQSVTNFSPEAMIETPSSVEPCWTSRVSPAF